MADIAPPTIKNRQDTWRELGAQQYNTPDDLFQSAQPVAYDTAKPKVGVIDALIKGLPNNRDSGFQYDPLYKPTFGETVASTLTDFARSGTAVAAEWTPEYEAARLSLNELRKKDPEMADKIEEASIGHKLSDSKLAIKGAAAVGEGILTVLPFFKAGRVAVAVGEAGLINKTAIGTKILASPLLQKLYSGGLNGFLYGGLYGLHSQEGDWKEAAKSAAVGAGFGVGLMGGISGLAFLGKYGGNKALQGFKFIGETGKKLGVPSLAEVLPEKWYANIFGVGSAMKKYYGEIGDNFLTMYKKASRLATTDLGKIQLEFIDNGLMRAPSGFGKAFKGVEFVGDDTERMLNYNQILRGQGAYANKAARDAAIAADPKLQFLDGLRRNYAAAAKEAGVTKNFLDPDTYLPKHTPVIELSKKSRAQLASATTQAEREAIYAANDPMVKDMVQNSVSYGKDFKTLEESYGTYYDYADAVKGGSHTPMGDNRMLQRMVRDGKAATMEEARGKIIADLKQSKLSLTPAANSLDFERQVDLPWYDPNPSRVMQQYTFDASMRIEMAKMFGVNDQVIHEMIGSIRADLTGEISADAAAKSFEGFVRVVTGQVFSTQKEQRVSAFLRAIQIPKLFFAQIMNLGQSLNTLLASDLGTVTHGLTTAFTVPEIRNAVERGVLMNQFIRQIFEAQGAGGGSKFTDKLLKYNGFTFTEMFNRVVGSSASDVWGQKNLDKLLIDYKLSEKGIPTKRIQFVSPNVQETQTFEQATANMRTPGYEANFRSAESSYIDDGLRGALKKGRGDWVDGAEETFIKEVTNDVSDEQAIYSLSKNAKGLQQKDAIDFKIDVGGKDELYTINSGTKSVEEIRTILNDNGITFKTIGEDTVYVVNSGEYFDSGMLDKLSKIEDTTGIKIKMENGTATFVTKVEDRLAAQEIYDTIINNYEQKYANKPTSKVQEGSVSRQSVQGEKAGQATQDRQAILEKIKIDQSREYWALKELGVDPDEVIARGYFTPEEKAVAAQTFVERTQFLANPSDLPMFASSPSGKILFQFKTFTYQQARFVTQELKNSFGRGDYKRGFRNLFILSTVFPMTGEVLADVRSLITQEKRPTKFLDRYISDVFSAGTYGLFYDFYKSAEKGKTSEALLGSTVGDAIRYLEIILKAPGQIISGNGDTALTNFSKQLLRQTGVGRVGVNILYPSSQPGKKSTLQSLIDWAAD